MSQGPDTLIPASTIEAYVEACRTGDVATLRSLFHIDSLMCGYFEGDFHIGSPEVFFDEIAANPPPWRGDTEYRATITMASSHGSIASVELRESGYLGSYSLYNLFQLVLVNGRWLIVSKSYSDDAGPSRVGN